ncbi:MAG TPA: hypothetical protein DDY25_03555 [Peptococcaceae bacterium]|nr:hypothetical protein [Peptococcaceae bacterium]
MSITERGFALLLGLGISFFLIIAGALLAFAYAILSNQVTFYLSSYFTCVFFLSVFCGGYATGKKGGIRSWVSAGLIGLITGGAVLLLFNVTASFVPGIKELLAMLFLPTILGSTGALIAANTARKQQHGLGIKLTS